MFVCIIGHFVTTQARTPTAYEARRSTTKDMKIRGNCHHGQLLGIKPADPPVVTLGNGGRGIVTTTRTIGAIVKTKHFTAHQARVTSA